MDPVKREGYDPHKYREPNPQAMSQMRARAQAWRAAVEAANDMRAELDRAVIQAKDAGHSFAQIREATGLGTRTIQMVLLKAGRI